MRHNAIVLCFLAAPLYGQTFIAIESPHHVYDGGWEHFVGGGIAAFDCDDDLQPELFVAGGTAPAKLLRNTSEVNVSFRDLTPETLAVTGVSGAYPLDYDNDGHVDLAVLRVGENMLLRGQGGCEFEKAQLPTSDRWTTSFSATWEQNRSLPTLAFGNYVDRHDPDGPFEACDQHELYRPEGLFYTAPILIGPGFCTLSMLFTDWARTGRQDLRVSNDRHYYVRGGQEQLWAMEEEPRLFDQEEGWIKHELWGMGIASRDISGDGQPDVFLSSMGDQRFQIRDGDGPSYTDAAFEYGLTAHVPFSGEDGRPSTGWHAVFGDVQNDGWDDVFVTKGNVEQMPGSAIDDPNNLLVRSQTGFVEHGDHAGLASMRRSRGAVLIDFNRDGLLDVAVVNRRASMEIYQNTTSDTGNFIGLSLRQEGINSNAIGAWIELEFNDRIMPREITAGGGHAGGVLGPEHFGIGSAETARARVIWPDGAISDWADVPVGTYSVLSRQGVELLVHD